MPIAGEFILSLHQVYSLCQQRNQRAETAACSNHADCAVLQDIGSLMQDHPGVYTSPNISFGLKQIVSQHDADSQPHAGSSSYIDYMQQYDHHQQPFTELLGTIGDSQRSVDQEQLYCFRQIVVKNNQADNVQLIDVRFSQKLPMWPHTMALIDDAGISTVVQVGKKIHMRTVPVSGGALEEEKVDKSDHHQQRQRRN